MSQLLYDTDFYTWTQEQAEALRTKNLAALDLDHLAEEIEDVGNSVRFALESHLVRLLLQLRQQPHQLIALHLPVPLPLVLLHQLLE